MVSAPTEINRERGMKSMLANNPYTSNDFRPIFGPGRFLTLLP
jgi:hypothetical protein